MRRDEDSGGTDLYTLRCICYHGDMQMLPEPGFLLTRPYDPKGFFKPTKDAQGEALISVVERVGEDVMDSEGILRTTPVTKGDIIIHAFNAKDFEWNMKRYRFVHFTEVYGIMKEDN